MLSFPPKWLEVPIDDDNFHNFIKAVDILLSGPQPLVSETCKWCIYRKYFESIAPVASVAVKEASEDIPF